MKLLQQLRRLRRSRDPLIEVRISRSAILNNYEAFKKAYGIPVAPVLKSNAYGHGLVEVAEIVSLANPPMIVVDSLHEGDVLRRNGVATPILIVGYTRAETIVRTRVANVAFTITSLDGLRALCEKGSEARVHVKLDTGMHRQGLPRTDHVEAIRLLRASRLRLEGVCSHFADADGEGEEFTRAQIATWNEYAAAWREAFPSIRYFHLAATAGSAFTKDIDATMVRLGTGLYGFPRHASQTFDLAAALSMHTLITGIKDLASGEKVGYNITYTAEKPMRIATVPVGYFEGVDRRLSNKGSMLVGDTPCPILGRVSMNITSIDISNCPDAALETAVTVFSGRKDEPNSLVNAALLCATTPLELLVHIPQHLRRTVVA